MKRCHRIPLFCVILVFAGSTIVCAASGTPRPVAAKPAAPGEVAADVGAALSFAEAQEKIAASRRYVAHPPRSEDDHGEAPLEDCHMATPPPPARAEKAPPSPVAGYVWVAGHYMPVGGKWRWVRGEWAAPATPSSVWIPARYDAREKKWTPGYWQPDRPAAPENSAVDKDAAPSEARY